MCGLGAYVYSGDDLPLLNDAIGEDVTGAKEGMLQQIEKALPLSTPIKTEETDRIDTIREALMKMYNDKKLTLEDVTELSKVAPLKESNFTEYGKIIEAMYIKLY